jgi:general secretion pathway protein G
MTPTHASGARPSQKLDGALGNLVARSCVFPWPVIRRAWVSRFTAFRRPARASGLEPRACGSGFTLIELVITVAIIAILALGLVPLTQLASQRGKEQELRAGLREIRTAIDAYKKAADENRIEKKADQVGYPPNLEVLAEGAKDIKTPDGKMIYFLRRIPRDPFSEDDRATAAKTWGLRSYASPPNEPREGEDVFDVYSLSKRTGLNGIAYKEW